MSDIEKGARTAYYKKLSENGDESSALQLDKKMSEIENGARTAYYKTTSEKNDNEDESSPLPLDKKIISEIEKVARTAYYKIRMSGNEDVESYTLPLDKKMSEIEKGARAAYYKKMSSENKDESLVLSLNNRKMGPSSKGTNAMDHMMDHHSHHFHVESSEMGMFTIDDVLAFKVGQKLPIFFPIHGRSYYPPFLPKQIADSIPFSSSQVSNILHFFSISPDSPKGKAIRDTLKKCEIEAAQGETKTCATSFESLLGFLNNVFGHEVEFKYISTRHPTMTAPILQNYTVLESPQEVFESSKKVSCHPMPYLYAIYFCHYDATETKTFKLGLVGDITGDKVDAVVVCHMDTSSYSSNHIAFNKLGIKHGDPTCHVFTQGNVVWVQ